jgi:hypothetical protein
MAQCAKFIKRFLCFTLIHAQIQTMTSMKEVTSCPKQVFKKLRNAQQPCVHICIVVKFTQLGK